MKHVALITGATSGIGLAFARIHAQKGNDLIIVARNAVKLDEVQIELQQSYGVEVKAIDIDLSHPNAAKEIFNEVLKDKIQIEYLINNAGFGGQGEFIYRDWHQEAKMIQVNVIALSELTHLFIPAMIKNGGGSILNVSSAVSSIPGPLQAVYFATKAYVTSFSLALSSELEHSSVSVTTLQPGATISNFASVSGMKSTDFFKKTVEPHEVAVIGYQAMLDKKRIVMVGVNLWQKLSLTLSPILPKSIVLHQVKKGQKIKSA